MLTYRRFNIFCVLLILTWIAAERWLPVSSPPYGWILLIYVSVLFCGSYFIRLNFFLPSLNFASTKEKVVALSFDDGPDPDRTVQILDLLRDQDVETVFFCIGKKIAGNELLIRRMGNEGHVLGNHSFSHHALFDLFSPGKMLEDMKATSYKIAELTGKYPKLFRPPYGVTNPFLKKAVSNGGFISIGWSIRSLDTMIKDRGRLLNKIIRQLSPGAIILLHDTSDTSLSVLKTLIEKIRGDGYQIVRLDKMLKIEPYE